MSLYCPKRQHQVKEDRATRDSLSSVYASMTAPFQSLCGGNLVSYIKNTRKSSTLFPAAVTSDVHFICISFFTTNQNNGYIDVGTGGHWGHVPPKILQ